MVLTVAIVFFSRRESGTYSQRITPSVMAGVTGTA
jgi:hypothetical protein